MLVEFPLRVGRRSRDRDESVNQRVWPWLRRSSSLHLVADHQVTSCHQSGSGRNGAAGRPVEPVWQQ